MYEDSGPIEDIEMHWEEDTGLLVYDQLKIITSTGQSGSPLQVC